MYKILDVVKKENGRIDYYVISNSKGQKKNISKSDLIVLIDENKVENGVVYRYEKQTIINITKERKSSVETASYYLGLQDFDGNYFKIDLFSRKLTKSTKSEIMGLIENKQIVGCNYTNKLNITKVAFLSKNFLVLCGLNSNLITKQMYKFPIKDISLFETSDYALCRLALLYVKDNIVKSVSPLLTRFASPYSNVELSDLKESDFGFSNGRLTFKMQDFVIDDAYQTHMDCGFDDDASCSKKFDISCELYVDKSGFHYLQHYPAVYGLWHRNSLIQEKKTKKYTLPLENFSFMDKDPVWFFWGTKSNTFYFYKCNEFNKQKYADYVAEDKKILTDKQADEEKKKKIEKENKNQKYSSPLPNEKFLIGYDIAEGRYYKIGLISHILVKTTEKEIKTLMSKNKAMGVEVDRNGELLTGGLISLFSDDYILYYDELSYKDMPPIYRKDGNRNITISIKDTEYLLYFGYYSYISSPCTVYIISRSGQYLNIAAPLLFAEASTGGRKYNIIQDKGIWYNYCNYTSHLYHTGATVHHTDINFGLSIEKSVLKYYKSHDKSSETIESIKLKELNKLLKENGGWFIK